MNPAPSVILFTTLSGAGYGVAIVAGLIEAISPGVPGAAAMPIMLASLALIAIGLLSSVAHLGRPERAWRALSQWRSSWLSREGVLALVTFIPITGFAASWVFPTLGLGTSRIWGAIAAAASLATLFTTAMIYRSLKPIAQWNHPLVVPSYMTLGPMTGSAIVAALSAIVSGTPGPAGLTTVALLIAGGAVKATYWRSIDAHKARTIASAVGFPRATATSVEWPHSEENFLLKEMGFVVARRHSQRLRRAAIGLGWVAPLALSFVSILGGDTMAAGAAGLAAASSLTGVIVERWLFFAEARHTTSLYYGR